MNLLPTAPPAAPAGAPAKDSPAGDFAATAGSGDFTALVAMLVATASTTLPTQRPPAEPPERGNSAPFEPPAAEPGLPGLSGHVEPGPAPAPGLSGPVLPGPVLPGLGLSGPVLLGPVSAPGLPGHAEPGSVLSAPDLPGPVPPSGLPGHVERGPVPAPGLPAPGLPAPGLPAPGLPGPAGPGHAGGETAAPRAGEVPAPADLATTAAGIAVAEKAAPQRKSSPPVDWMTAPPAVDAPAVPVTATTAPRSTSAGAVAPQPGTPDTERRDIRSADQKPSPPAGSVLPQVAGNPVDRQERGDDIPVPEKAQGVPAPKITATVSSSVGSASPVVPLVAVNRSEALNPVDAPPATPVAPPNVPDQIVSAVVPLHGRGDGRHEVTLELRPDHLGTIRVEVTVEHQTVHLTLHAAEPATARLLSAALPELRAALVDAGLTAGQLGVGPDGGSGAGQWRNPSGAGETHEGRSSAGHRGDPNADDPEPVRPVRPATAGRLDLFL